MTDILKDTIKDEYKLLDFGNKMTADIVLGGTKQTALDDVSVPNVNSGWSFESGSEKHFLNINRKLGAAIVSGRIFSIINLTWMILKRGTKNAD